MVQANPRKSSNVPPWPDCRMTREVDMRQFLFRSESVNDNGTMFYDFRDARIGDLSLSVYDNKQGINGAPTYILSQITASGSMDGFGQNITPCDIRQRVLKPLISQIEERDRMKKQTVNEVSLNNFPQKQSTFNEQYTVSKRYETVVTESPLVGNANVKITADELYTLRLTKLRDRIIHAEIDIGGEMIINGRFVRRFNENDIAAECTYSPLGAANEYLVSIDCEYSSQVSNFSIKGKQYTMADVTDIRSNTNTRFVG